MSLILTFAAISLFSPALQEQSPIPPLYTCKEEDMSPPLSWTPSTSETKSYALVLIDPDAPGGNFVHWLMYNISPEICSLPPNLPKIPVLPSGAMQGTNSFETIGYAGPCPPQGQTHSYIFVLYALDSLLALPPGTSYADFQSAVQGHIIEETRMTALFGK